MAFSLAVDNSNPVLSNLIVERIVNHTQRRIPFAEYMDLALYHPEHGYYATNRVNIGGQGDFVTSPYLGSDFGELLAAQFAQMWSVLGDPNPFTLVEMGAGQGLLVQDILTSLHRHHPSCFKSLEYLIIETSPALLAAQQRRFGSFAQSWGQLRWCTWNDIPSNSIVGCFFSNELVDAFPVHQVERVEGQLREVYVGIEHRDDGTVAFREVIGDISTPRLRDYFEFVGIPLLSDSYPDGYRADVNLAALDWMTTVADRLQQGYVLTIDYGYPASRYYSRGRSQGTLQCYYQHAHHSNPYIHIGRQDITAHVDFTALERQGEQEGLHFLGFTQQGLFLMALGLGDRLAALSDPIATQSWSINDVLQRREVLHSLINPMGLGNFGVLLQGKGLTDYQRHFQLTGIKPIE